jgi:hypothetical protein
MGYLIFLDRLPPHPNNLVCFNLRPGPLTAGIRRVETEHELGLLPIIHHVRYNQLGILPAVVICFVVLGKQSSQILQSNICFYSRVGDKDDKPRS